MAIDLTCAKLNAASRRKSPTLFTSHDSSILASTALLVTLAAPQWTGGTLHSRPRGCRSTPAVGPSGCTSCPRFGEGDGGGRGGWRREGGREGNERRRAQLDILLMKQPSS